MDKKQVIKQIKAVGIGALLVGAGAFVGAHMFPKTVTEQVEVLKEVPGQTVTVEVIKEVPVEVVKEVAVDSGNLEMVLEELYDKNGEVSYLTNDLEEDELNQIVDRLVLTQDWQNLAMNKVRAKLFDELDGVSVNSTELDEDDMRSLKIETEDIEFENIDFEDFDAEVIVPFKFRQDDDKFEGNARVTIRDGEVDDLDIDSIVKE